MAPLPNPDWGALLRDPNFRLFFESDAVQQQVAASVRACCEAGAPYEEVQYHRGILEGIRKLEHLPELAVKRDDLKAGREPQAQEESARRRWRVRLAESWGRAWQQIAGRAASETS